MGLQAGKFLGTYPCLFIPLGKISKKMKRLLLIPILLLGFGSKAQVPMSGTGNYTQDFNTLARTGTNITCAPGRVEPSPLEITVPVMEVF